MKVCIGCEQPMDEPHLGWCPVVTGTLNTLEHTKRWADGEDTHPGEDEEDGVC
jgi:hypothetical protein